MNVVLDPRKSATARNEDELQDPIKKIGLCQSYEGLTMLPTLLRQIPCPLLSLMQATIAYDHAFAILALYFKVVKSRRMRWAGHVARMGKNRGVHRVLVGKSEGKRPLGRPRRRWEDNIKIDLQEVGWGSMAWIALA